MFNLNLLISGLRRLVSVPRSFLLAKMANDDDSKDSSKDDPEDDSEGPYIPGNDSTIDSTATIRGKKKSAKRNWKRRAEDFEVFPRQDEGPRSSSWLLFFYAIRLLVLKVFDLIIDLLAWLRGIIAPSPSNRVSRSSMK